MHLDPRQRVVTKNLPTRFCDGRIIKRPDIQNNHTGPRSWLLGDRRAAFGARVPTFREVKARLHQASFRDAVLTAYGGRCAISHLPEPRLLDAAHIIIDSDEQLGQPIVSNGLPLTKLHHAAFDDHLIGIDLDFRIHISDRLLEINDGPFLELWLKGIARTLIELPRRIEDRPDRDRLRSGSSSSEK